MIIQEEFEVARETWLEYGQQLRDYWIEDIHLSGNSIWVIRLTPEMFNGHIKDIKIHCCKDALVSFAPNWDIDVPLKTIKTNLIQGNIITGISLNDTTLCLTLGTDLEPEMIIEFKLFEKIYLML